MDELKKTGMQLPNVLHLDHSVEAGGAELALVRLINAASNWTPSILLPKQADSKIGVFERVRTDVALETVGPSQTPGVSSKASPVGFFLFVTQIVGQAVAVRRSSAFRNADVIHANTSRSSLYGALACLGSGKKLVLHLRDHVSKDSLGSIGMLAFTHIALRRANGLIGNSKSTLATATQALGSKQALTTVIPSPIGQLRPASLPQANHSALRIGMIARIDPWKGQSLLIEAFAQAFPDSREELFFAGGCLFGHEEHLESLKRDVISRGLQKRVHFLGHIEDISDVMQNLDVCIQASLRPEPLGQNVLQYLAAGKAVVASNEGGPAEWITHNQNGLLFEPRNANSLAQTLRALSSDRASLERLQKAATETPGLMSDPEVSAAHGHLFADIVQI